MGKILKREVRRRRHSISAWITVEGSFINKECQLIDVSKTGAKILVEWATVLPTRFQLKRIPNSAESTICEVVWRRGRMHGIKFVQ
jgi:PilZ domain-containing protein